MFQSLIKMAGISALLLCTTSCNQAAKEPTRLADEFTLGKVQQEVRVGMSQGEVAERLGSPNIVTRDNSGKETWIYDKIAKEVSYSQSSGYVSLLIIGAQKQQGSSQQGQKTLTVVIKFTDQKLVDSFTYHSSRF
ncbi:MAG: hypothetical protein K0S07_471 [Chlamydiales bacterium]|jgi:outer membrane protein assembly factor BamE (lipoprotein component of BamABCDE complex)|nr:hypothetical protein [Chlamydiales bacterium]